MMRRWFILLSTIILLLTACSSDGEQSSESSDVDTAPNSEAMENSAGSSNESDTKSTSSKEQSEIMPLQQERKVIFNAHLSLTVDQLKKASDQLNQLTTSYKGYIVEESTSTEGESLFGSMTVRIPQNQFHSFLDEAEAIGKGSSQKSITGSDVTKEYVDLSSRLKAKETVMKRLESFLDKATKTDDLLAISNDLSRVQEEIEQLKGRIQYLDNQSEFSTVTISFEQHKVTVPKIGENELNTFSEAKNLFMTTVNGILSFFSTTLVFLIGLSPVLVPLIAIGLFFFIRYRKAMKKADQES
ncbi:MAG: DUF4349 domain-containing protein [Anaerobacillus sp.]